MSRRRSPNTAASPRCYAQIVRLDASGRLQNAVAQKFQGPIRKLLENKYVFRPFWMNMNGGGGDWQKAFRSSALDVRQSMIDKDVAGACC